MQNLEDPPVRQRVIEQTREMVKAMSKEERFAKAKRHLMDALNNKTPRNDFEMNRHTVFRLAYLVQTSTLWNTSLFVSSFIFMYLIVGEPNNRLHKHSKLNVPIVFLQVVILSLFWTDILLDFYHKLQWEMEARHKFPLLFQLKTLLICLLTIDTVIYYLLYQEYPIRVFRILRPFLPYFYNHFARRAFQSLISIYQDIIVYTIFYFSIIFFFGLLGTQLITFPEGTQFDMYKSNYQNFGQSSFLFYILASFDSWPDYWMIVVDTSRWYYLLFVTFILFNFFYFVTIPTTVMFNSFKKTRSALMLVDQIQQRNSLLLCFICLGEDKLCIKSETFHQFMLYVYRNKLRMVDQIKQLRFRLDKSNSSEIFITNFFSMCVIIDSEPKMYPPMFDDWEPYVRFRKFLKTKLHLQSIVESTAFKAIIVLSTVANLAVVLTSYYWPPVNSLTLEVAFIVVYWVEIVLRILGQGLQKYFSKVGNSFQLGLAFLYALVLGLYKTIYMPVLIELLGLFRIFRIPRVFSIVFATRLFQKFYMQNILLRKLRVIVQDLYVSITIGVKMFPLFMTLYYVLGIVGIEAYDQTFLEAKSSNYSGYDSVANFRSFLLSQVIIVQSMVEAGWSLIIFDHAQRFGNTVLVYLYFICIHIVIDTTIFSIMKGIFAELYEKITIQFQAIDKSQQNMFQEQELIKERKEEVKDIKMKIKQGRSFGMDSLKKKMVYENKLDKRMMESLKVKLSNQFGQKKITLKEFQPTVNKSVVTPNMNLGMYIETKISALPSLRKSDIIRQKKKYDNKISIQENSQISSAACDPDVEDQEEISFESQDNLSRTDSDIEDIEDQLLDQVVLEEGQIPYAQSPVYPKFLVEFLTKKLIVARQRVSKAGPFNPNTHSIKSRQSLSFYTNVLQSLLDIKKPEQQRKQQIMEDILKLKIQNTEELRTYLNKKEPFQKTILIGPIWRKIMLSNISEQFIKKFQIQYFSGVYGNSFREINMSSLTPLLRHEALMVYSLNRLLRYPPPESFTFWNAIASIQDNMSRTLLNPGSIFIFVFQVKQLANNWFSLELTQNMQIKINFLKTGIWVYHQKMRTEQVHFAEDIFHCSDEDLADNEDAQQTIRFLYNAFETLGLSMMRPTDFFGCNPSRYSYNLYTFLLNCAQKQNKDTQDIIYETKQEDQDSQTQLYLKVTNIMGVVLSKEGERDQPLKYQLSNLKTILQQQREKKKEKAFKFDEDQTKTLQKLQLLIKESQQRLIDSESLEHAYLIDTIESIRDSCLHNLQNLVKQAEVIVNKQFSNAELRD